MKYLYSKCEFQFKEMVSLKEHKEYVHEGIRYTCNQGEYQCPNKSNLRKHQLTKHIFMTKTNLRHDVPTVYT